MRDLKIKMDPPPTLQQVKNSYILAVLKLLDNSVPRTAATLRISRRTIERLLYPKPRRRRRK